MSDLKRTNELLESIHSIRTLLKDTNVNLSQYDKAMPTEELGGKDTKAAVNPLKNDDPEFDVDGEKKRVADAKKVKKEADKD